MYYFGKAALLVWCMLYNGSEVIYYNFIKPLFLKHEKEIDNLVETKGAGTLNKIVGEVGEKSRLSDLWKDERAADDRFGYGLILLDGGSTSCCMDGWMSN